jgi:hypothetical protein
MDIAKMRQNRWLRLAIFLVSLIAISFGLAYALQGLFSHFQLVPDRFFLLAYIFVFGTPCWLMPLSSLPFQWH